MAVDDSIQVRCTRCKGKFRDKARRVREGYSRQCPSCECMVFFIEGSPNKDVADAMREAERVRKLLRQEEDEKALARAASVAEARDSDDGQAAPAGMSRRMERRVRPGGRSS
jgi:predicted  nucleic acid-binding Zn-ribbon protein